MAQQNGKTADGLALGLGVASIAVGLIELARPGAIGRALGMEGAKPLLQAFGLREMGHAAAILGADDKAPGLWSRVGGDALDAATLLPGLHPGNSKRGNVALALAAVAGLTLLDVVAVKACEQKKRRPRQLTHDYSDRVGLGGSPDAMRGLARTGRLTAETFVVVQTEG